MPLRAVFFDVGDTLVQHWKPQPEIRALTRDALRREFGERAWYDKFVEAEIAPDHRHDSEEDLRQETNRWYADWFRNSQIGLDDIEIDHFRVATTLPLDLVGALVPGTPAALRWCKAQGLIVGLITNTLSRGDEEVRTDWERFGLSGTVDVVVSSHSAGWQKPHAAIFRRALELSGVPASHAVMVGDRMVRTSGGRSASGCARSGAARLRERPRSRSTWSPMP